MKRPPDLSLCASHNRQQLKRICNIFQEILKNPVGKSITKNMLFGEKQGLGTHHYMARWTLIYLVKLWRKHSEILKHCPENISPVVKSSIVLPKTLFYVLWEIKLSQFCVFEFCHNWSLSFVTICVLSQFEFLSFVAIWVFEFCWYVICVTIWIELCQNLSFCVLSQFVF